MAKFEFEQWCTAEEISDKTKAVLVDEELNTEKALKRFQVEDVSELGLSRGQTAVLKGALVNLQAQPHAASSTGSPSVKVDDDPTTKTLAKDKDLNHLLSNLGEMSMKDLLSMEESEIAATMGSSGTRKKYESIPDNLSKSITDSSKRDRTLLNLGGDTDVVLRGNKPRKKPEEVTFPQWISAHARILKKLLNKDVPKQTLLDYIDYTIQFGDYAQLYTQASMMQLDDAHRQSVHEDGVRWQNISDHHFRFWTRTRPDNSSGTGVKSTGPSGGQKKKPTEDRVCYDYNNDKCHYNPCKYKHVCLTCGGNHPKSRHEETPPRFRSEIP